MKQKFTYLLSLMLMCILGVSNAMAADVTVGLTQAIDATNHKLGVVTSTSATDIACSANTFGSNINFYKETGSDKTPSINGTKYATETHWRKTVKDTYENQWVGYTLTIAEGKQFNITGVHAMIAVCDDTYNWYVEITNSSDEVLYKSLEKTTKKASTTDFSVSTSALDQAVQAKLAGIKGTINVRVYVKQSGNTKYFAIPYLTVTGNVEAASAVVTPPSFITDLDESYEVTVGRSLTLTVSAKDADSYQWYNGETAIDGATKSSYTFAPTAEGISSIHCVAKNTAGSSSSTVATVTAVPWKPITTARSWDFTKGDSWKSGMAASTGLWTDNSSKKRYSNAVALANEELCDNNGVLSGLTGVYITGGVGNVLLSYNTGKPNELCLQISGNSVKVTIPDCNVKDRIYIRFGANGDDKTGIISSASINPSSISKKGSDRTNAETVVVTKAGDVELTLNTSIRLYEIKVTPYIAVTDFELSTDEVSVEEYENVSVSAKNFTPANYTDGTMEWTTSDAAVATVNNGVITGVKAGTATITATSVDGPSKSLEVTVTACAPKNVSIEMTSDSEAKAPKVESGKTYTLTAKAQGYDLKYQWASKTSEKGSYVNIGGATAQTYQQAASELGSKFYKVTITNAQGSAVAEYEVKTVVPLEAFTIANEDGTGGINYKALDSDDPEVRIVYQIARADEPVELEIADSVEYAGVTYAVTVVGEEAFVNDMTVVELETSPVLREIGARAFMACVNLADVELAEGLEIIGDAAFAGCTKLPIIFIPSTVQYVGFKAFADCTSLTDIFYDGTKAEWNALPNIGMAGIAKSVTIHFNDGETENGKGNIVGINNANADEAQKNGKFFENGELIIYKNGKAFTAAGAEKK